MAPYWRARFALCVAVAGACAWPARTSAHDAAAMANAASTLLESLSDAEARRASFAFASDDRVRWHYFPTETFPRKGIPLEELDAGQRTLADALLRTGLSERGYRTASTIIELERVLQSTEPSFLFFRDPGKYYVSVFGSPDAQGIWGWRFEGHHLSLHFTLVEGRTSVSSPSFFGANPAEVRAGPSRGVRPLGAAEDAGRRLFQALAPPQRAAALISDTAPSDIVSGTRASADPLSPHGIRAGALSPEQRALLEAAIDASTSLMANDVAAERWTRIRKAGLEAIAFAWAGSAERGKPHYYRIQGPTFLLEYDNAQSGANHIHLVWREFEGDFGRDLLREHLATVRH